MADFGWLDDEMVNLPLGAMAMADYGMASKTSELNWKTCDSELKWCGKNNADQLYGENRYHGKLPKVWKVLAE